MLKILEANLSDIENVKEAANLSDIENMKEAVKAGLCTMMKWKR